MGTILQETGNLGMCFSVLLDVVFALVYKSLALRRVSSATSMRLFAIAPWQVRGQSRSSLLNRKYQPDLALPSSLILAAELHAACDATIPCCVALAGGM